MNGSLLVLLAMLLGVDPWHGKTLDGKDVVVPADKPSVMLFLRPGQKQSDEALKFVRTLTEKAPDVAVIVVVSGEGAEMRAQQAVKDQKITWPVVVDAQFEASGAFDVHVWPTTVVVNVKGDRVAHVASVPSAYLKDMEVYLDHVRGKIDDTALKQRLATSDVIADSPQQMAERHLKVAQQLADRRRADLAKSELEKAMSFKPEDPAVKLTIADLLSQLGEPAQALAYVELIPAEAAPPWRMALIRARSLVRLNRFEEALEPLKLATGLNPRPAEAWYLTGLVHQKASRQSEAAEAFRKAYESSSDGKSRVVAQ